jgi:hypothetical protein
MSIAMGSFTEAYKVYMTAWQNDECSESLEGYSGGSSEEKQPLNVQIENFGEKWIVTRENFLSSALAGIIGSIHCFVIALFESGFALIEGKTKDKHLNEQAIKAWKETGQSLRYTGESIIGIFAPSLAIEVDDFIAKKINESSSY